MKFALYGALTLGTLDGANIEIRDAVGHDNFFLFGMDTRQVAALWAAGYDPRVFIERSPVLAEALELIASGFFSLGERDRFKPIVNSLRDHDGFMVCADFDSYVACEAHAGTVYRQPRDWSRRAALNIAGASQFSSDNTIRQYAEEIWNITPRKTDLSLIDR